MPDTDGTGYTPHRFQVYLNGKPVGNVYAKDDSAQRFAATLRDINSDVDIEIVALGPDQDPKTVVIPGYPHEPAPSVNVSATDSKLPPYYHIIFGKTVLGFGDDAPWNIFNKDNANAIRAAAIADMTADDSLPVEEANRLVKVVQVGDG